jgi:NAD(P)-dependent dehydrogenase (short-subunit alcohol dehydrogenase family)
MNSVIVTGAGSGIGLAVAQKLADLGYNVVVNDFDEGSAIAAAQKIGRI